MCKVMIFSDEPMAFSALHAYSPDSATVVFVRIRPAETGVAFGTTRLFPVFFDHVTLGGGYPAEALQGSNTVAPIFALTRNFSSFTKCGTAECKYYNKTFYIIVFF